MSDIGDIAVTLLSAGAANKQAKKQMNFTASENQKARDWSEMQQKTQRAQELADREHEERYNNPAAQKARMQLAGLAPEGSADQIASNSIAGDAESVDPMSPADFNPSGIGSYANPISSGLDGLARLAQIKNLNTNSAKQASETETEELLRQVRFQQLKVENDHIRAITQGANLSNEAQTILNKWLDAREENAVNLGKKQIDLTEAQTGQVKTGIEKLRKEIDELMPAEIKKINAESGLISEKVLSEQKNREYLEKAMQKIDAEISLLSQQTGLAEKDLYYYTENHMQNGIFGTGLTLGNQRRLAKQATQEGKPVTLGQSIGRATANFIGRKISERGGWKK